MAHNIQAHARDGRIIVTWEAEVFDRYGVPHVGQLQFDAMPDEMQRLADTLPKRLRVAREQRESIIQRHRAAAVARLDKLAPGAQGGGRCGEI